MTMQPGQFFTEYLDMLPRLKHLVSKRDYKAAVECAVTARRSGVMFALPNGGRMTDRAKSVSMAGDLFRPPYPVCILEFVGEHRPEVPVGDRATKRVIIVVDKGTHVDIFPLAYRDRDSAWHPAIFKFSLGYGAEVSGSVLSGTFKLLTAFSGVMPDTFSRIADGYYKGDLNNFGSCMADDFVDELWAYADFCRVLHENEVTFDEVKPDKAQNQSRRARGKAPLFTYKVLTVGKKKRKSRQLGGTHASPRSHLRRGYYRTSKHGVRHWVQPCMVKGDTDGFVHKDYRVEATV